MLQLIDYYTPILNNNRKEISLIVTSKNVIKTEMCFIMKINIPRLNK